MKETVQQKGHVNAYASLPESAAAQGGAGEGEGGGNGRGQGTTSPPQEAEQPAVNARGYAGENVPGMQYGNAGALPHGGQYGYAGGGVSGAPYALGRQPMPPAYAQGYAPFPPMMPPYCAMPHAMQYAYAATAPMGAPTPAEPTAEAKSRDKSATENPSPQTGNQSAADAPFAGEAPGQAAAGNRQQAAPAWTPEQAQAYAAGLAAARYAPFAAQSPPQDAAGGGHHCGHGATHGRYSENQTPGQSGPFDPFGFQAMFGGASPFGAGAPQNAPDPRETERRFGQAMEIYTDFMQGKSDPSKIMDFLASTGAHFWKGAAVGALLALLLTNSTVKSTIGEAFSGLFGKGGDSPE